MSRARNRRTAPHVSESSLPIMPPEFEPMTAEQRQRAIRALVELLLWVADERRRRSDAA